MAQLSPSLFVFNMGNECNNVKFCAAEVMFGLVELMLSLCFFLIFLLVGLPLGCIPKMSLLSCLEVLVELEYGFRLFKDFFLSFGGGVR